MTNSDAASGRSVTRRKLLLKVSAGLNGLAAALFCAPVLGYVLSGFGGHRKKEAWISLGALDRFPEGETRLATYRNPFTRPWDGETAEIPCWVRRISGDKLQVFAINCTHLGCPVRWFPGARLFLCPCHGGAFYEDGSHASGPPPRGLFEYSYRIEDGKLMILGGHLPTLAEPLSSSRAARPCGGRPDAPAGERIQIDPAPANHREESC